MIAHLMTVLALSTPAQEDLSDAYFGLPVADWATVEEQENSPFHRNRLDETPYATLLRDRGLADVVEDLGDRFRAQDWGADRATHQRLESKVWDFQDRVREAFDETLVVGGDAAARQAHFVSVLNLGGWGVTSFQTDSRMDDASGEDYVYYFLHNDPDLAFLTAHVVDGEWVGLVSEENMRQWALLADTFTVLLNDHIHDLRAENAQVFIDAVENWERYFDEGYSQYPWESIVNGWFYDDDGGRNPGPPDTQWIVMHPSLGVEIGIDDLESSRVSEVLNIEVLGHLWYNDDWSDYRGLSLTATLRDDMDPGLGFLWHINRDWNMGLAWHDHADDPFLMFSMDLYSFVGHRSGVLEQQLETTRSRTGRRGR